GSDCLRRPGRRREGGSAAPEPQSRDGKRMKEHATGARRSLSTFALLTLTTMTGAAWAQATPADVPPVPPPPAAEMAAPPSVPPPPAAAVPPVVEATPPPAPTPPTSSEAMPATRPEALPPIDVGAWVRVGSRFQKPDDPNRLGDWHMDTDYVELPAGGKVHKNVGVTLNLNANMLSWNGAGVPSAGSLVALEDAIISFDFYDEFHLWAGHLLVPVDRSNASGPFFMIPWNYPGFFSGGFIGAPYEGPSGRNNGAVLWGDIAGGKFSYFAGAFDNGNVTTSPLFSGKLRLALWDPEPGFWGNGSYFGDKDMLSIDVGGQVQKNGSIGRDKNYAEVNVDALIEKKLGGGSFVTGEAAYYHFNQDSGGVSDSMYALVAYATPTIGVGSLQPMVRFQWEKVKDNPATNPWNVDVGLSYLIKGPALRVLATY